MHGGGAGRSESWPPSSWRRTAGPPQQPHPSSCAVSWPAAAINRCNWPGGRRAPRRRISPMSQRGFRSSPSRSLFTSPPIRRSPPSPSGSDTGSKAGTTTGRTSRGSCSSRCGFWTPMAGASAACRCRARVRVRDGSAIRAPRPFARWPSRSWCPRAPGACRSTWCRAAIAAPRESGSSRVSVSSLPPTPAIPRDCCWTNTCRKGSIWGSRRGRCRTGAGRERIRTRRKSTLCRRPPRRTPWR